MYCIAERKALVHSYTRTCPVSQEWLHQGNVRWTAHVIQLRKRNKQTEFWEGSLSDGDNLESQQEYRKMIQWIILGNCAKMITLTSLSIDI
jgi:hypothetical protein